MIQLNWIHLNGLIAMKLNSNLVLTMILLTLMVAAGIVSAAYSFALGREALKGITQPDVRPINNLPGQEGTGVRQGTKILREEDILKRVKAQMGQGKPTGTTMTNESRPQSPTDSQKSDSATVDTANTLPIVSQDRKVKLEVTAVRREGDSLVLDVRLVNGGDQPVRFLYSFLDVTDDRGRSLSATTSDLPSELPPQSDLFSGRVTIPAVLVEDAKQLSLALTDYPEQRLQLKLSGIPVVR
ncbi:MAG: hypothetical protein NZ772_06110 [Cyanobacteria bacterium]|nr:hypothetical protein [Cyanobacteriota bacterium]